jgi:hypothetical protein
MSCPPLPTAVNQHGPISRLAVVELQCVMRLCDKSTLIAFAQSSKRMLAAAQSKFAWGCMPIIDHTCMATTCHHFPQPKSLLPFARLRVDNFNASTTELHHRIVRLGAQLAGVPIDLSELETIATFEWSTHDLRAVAGVPTLRHVQIIAAQLNAIRDSGNLHTLTVYGQEYLLDISCELRQSRYRAGLKILQLVDMCFKRPYLSGQWSPWTATWEILRNLEVLAIEHTCGGMDLLTGSLDPASELLPKLRLLVLTCDRFDRALHWATHELALVGTLRPSLIVFVALSVNLYESPMEQSLAKLQRRSLQFGIGPSNAVLHERMMDDMWRVDPGSFPGLRPLHQQAGDCREMCGGCGQQMSPSNRHRCGGCGQSYCHLQNCNLYSSSTPRCVRCDTSQASSYLVCPTCNGRYWNLRRSSHPPACPHCAARPALLASTDICRCA